MERDTVLRVFRACVTGVGEHCSPADRSTWPWQNAQEFWGLVATIQSSFPLYILFCLKHHDLQYCSQRRFMQPQHHNPYQSAHLLTQKSPGPPPPASLHFPKKAQFSSTLHSIALGHLLLPVFLYQSQMRKTVLCLFLFFWVPSLSRILPRTIHISSKLHELVFPSSWVVFHHVYVSQFLYRASVLGHLVVSRIWLQWTVL